MTTVIIGPVCCGKTLIADALRSRNESRGIHTLVVDLPGIVPKGVDYGRADVDLVLTTQDMRYLKVIDKLGIKPDRVIDIRMFGDYKLSMIR